MDNQSRNPAVVILSVLLIGCLIWAIVASATVAKRNAALTRLQQELEITRTQADQKMMEAERMAADADKLRRVALKWEMDRQARLQQERAKAAAAAAAAAAPAAKTTSKTSAKTPAKTSAKTTTGKSASGTTHR